MLLCQTVTVITISYKDYSYNDHGYNEFMAITNKIYPKVVTLQYKPSLLERTERTDINSPVESTL